MATTIILITIKSLCEKYRISEEQFSKATYCVANGKTGYYVVESQTTDAEYHVKWNATYNALSCTCKAGEHGVPCWHKRSALANQEHFKATEQARRQQEQAEVEATAEYELEQAFRDLEDALEALDRIAHTCTCQSHCHC